MELAALQFDTFILCDDIRAEINGKLMLIGVYPTDIVVAQFPMTFGFLVHTQGVVTNAGTVKAAFSVEDEHGGVLFRSDEQGSASGQFNVGRFTINTNLVFTAHKECVVSFMTNINGVAHTLAKRKVVAVNSK